MRVRAASIGMILPLLMSPVAAQQTPRAEARSEPAPAWNEAGERERLRELFGVPTAIESPRWREREYDPKPSEVGERAGELRLPMPCGGAMVFRRVEVEGTGWLGEQRIALGGETGDRAPLDARRVAHIAGSFSGAPDSAAGTRHYYLGKYEVTELQYRVLGGPCPDKLSGRRPAVGVSWYDAVDFTRRFTEWLYQNAPDRLPEEDGRRGYLRLPTEAEWEYAARGGMAVDATAFRQAVFPTAGRALSDFAWMRESVSSSFEPRPVGSLRANPLGFYDILGNAAELVYDLFRLNVQGRSHGQAGGFLVKGGHFRTRQNTLSTSWRQEHPHFNPSTGRANRLYTVGFRLAISAPVLTSEQRVAALRREWQRLPQARAQQASGDQCRDGAQQDRSALASLQADLERCLMETGSMPVPAFPRPPPPPVQPPARLPPWSEVLRGLEDKQADEIRRIGLWFLGAGDPNRAFVLFKRAARMGDGWSALAIGAMYDPRLFESPASERANTPFSKPNPEMAICWYRAAQSLGERRATARMNALGPRLAAAQPQAEARRRPWACENIVGKVGAG